MKIEEVSALERAVRHRSSRPAEETEQQQPADQRHEREAKVVRVHVLEEQEATRRRGGRINRSSSLYRFFNFGIPRTRCSLWRARGKKMRRAS